MPTVSSSPAPARAWLAALLRGAEPGPMPDEAVLLDTAQAEGVLALCHDQLRRSPTWEQYPATLRVALIRHARQEAAVDMLRAAELREVLEALARQGLPVLLLKGAALAHILYPEPYLRSRCDTDLLLPSRDDAERAWRVLETLGYERPNAISGDLIVYQLNCHKIGRGQLTHAVDVQWRLSKAALFAEVFPFTELAAAAVPVPALGPSAHSLGLVHALLMACIHRVFHLPEGNGDRLIWLYDIHRLAERFTEKHWQHFTTLAEERTVCGACLDGLSTTEAWLATSLPEAVLRRLRTGAARERFDSRQARSRWGLAWLTFRALPSTAARLRWLGQNLFPDADYMRRKYNFHHSGWLPWFYGVRIVQGVAKRLRQGR
ncbi:MAG: nucleotidyltransferase family protein [Candidatus Contendobacter sp.]|nr:nucleotidyltransferase family protein [Candidatus Contendobacter sp.]